MKTVLLAGGHATRLWPVTKNRAKPLLPIGDRPIIDYLVQDIEANEVVISTNEKYAEDFRNYANEFDRDVTVSVESQGTEEEKPGTIGALIQLLNRQEIDEDLMVIAGDNLFSFDPMDFASFSEDRDGVSLVAYDLDSREEASQYGVVDVEGSEVRGFVEKPDNPPSSLVSTAVYYFPREHLDAFERYESFHRDHTDMPAEQYLDEPGRLIQWAVDNTQVNAYSFDGHWFDIGTPKGYIDACQQVLEGQHIEGETHDSEVQDSVVMDGATIRDSEVTSSIVFPGADIHGSELERSVIDRDASVKEKDLESSVVGQYSTIS
jgi:glucose-1-phosphate thymidylyltransferase